LISRILSSKFFFFAVVLLNVIGALYGFFFFYREQLLSTTPLLWVFVPDCPLASLFFAVSLLFLYFKKRFHWFYFLSAAMAFKYGFWTVFVLSVFPWHYFSPQTALLYGVLFVAHLGLMIEPIALIGRIEFKKWFLFPTALFLFLNELSDYFLVTHPPLPASAVSLMFSLTLLMSFASIIFAFVLFKEKKLFLIELPFLN
jgi:uncharacterized membrane protein YpjA